MGIVVLLLLIAALVLFLLAAFGAPGRVAWGWLGLAIFALVGIIGALPGLGVG